MSKKQFEYVQYAPSMKVPDGIYNALYNKEPSVIIVDKGQPSFVQFVKNSSIFDPKGILASSVELLMDIQKIPDLICSSCERPLFECRCYN